MPSTLGNVMFLTSLALPPAAVVLGLIFLAWPSGKHHRSIRGTRTASHHA